MKKSKFFLFLLLCIPCYCDKTLVIITGNVRGSSLAHESLERHLLKPCQADLFLCTQTPCDRSSYLYKLATYIEEYPPADDWRLVMDEVSRELFGELRWRKYKPTLLDECLVGKYDRFDKWTGIGSGFLTLYVRYHALKWLEKTGVLAHYDSFVISRSDFYYVADHPSISSLLAKNVHVAIPFAKADHGGICDRHAVVDRMGLQAYLGALEVFLEFHPEYGPYSNIEAVLAASLFKVHRLKPRRYLSPSYTVRSDSDGALTWSRGQRRDVNGLWIKQEDEYKEAQTCRPPNG